MICTALRFTRKGKGSTYDDRIFISRHEESSDIFEVKYSNPELKKDRMFLASFSGVLSYVEDTLMSMRLDVDPFEHIQIDSSIHPAIFFHVSDMDESGNRDIIMNMVRDSMRFSVASVPK
jgi:hypothetical protein